MTTGTTELSLLGWNTLLGGIDRDDRGFHDHRFEQQIDYLASLPDLDFLWIMEGTDWHLGEGRRIHDVAEATGLTAIPYEYETSRPQEGRHHTVLFYRAEKARLVTAGDLGRGAISLGATRAEFEVNGVRLLLLGAHLSYSCGTARLGEAHHLADYGRQFDHWPQDSVLLMDANSPDRRDPEPQDWSAIPRNLWHRYRKVLPDGEFGGWDLDAVNLLIASGWRDPQDEIPLRRRPTVGYWYANEQVPLHLDQALVTGRRIEVTDYRTLGAPQSFAPEIPAPADSPDSDLDLTDLSDHLPYLLRIRLHQEPIRATD
ncbi:hypothetical protein [Streptomyces sp. NPDC055036]